MSPNSRLRRRIDRSKRLRSVRLEVDVFCELGTPPRQALGRIRDFNENGCRIHTPRHVRETETLPLRIQLPGFSQEFNFKVEVRWVDFAGKSNLYDVGVRFIHTPRSKKILKDLLWELQSGNLPEMERKVGVTETRRYRKR